MIKQPKRLVAIISLVVTLPLLAAGCAGADGQGTSLNLASIAEMPADVQAAPVTVQEAYRFAVANPDVLTELPCYCGCGAMGHTSNYACYISGEKADGSLAYDSHALGCSICVDITQDAMRLLSEGKGIANIRAYVDQTYAQYGPSNMP